MAEKAQVQEMGGADLTGEQLDRIERLVPEVLRNAQRGGMASSLEHDLALSVPSLLSMARRTLAAEAERDARCTEKTMAEKTSADGATLLYKCRLCEELDGSCHAPNGVIALVCVMQDVPLPEHWGGMPVGKTSLHFCRDGRTGVSDLVGIEPDEKKYVEKKDVENNG